MLLIPARKCRAKLVLYLPTENTVVSPGCILLFPSLERPWRCSGCLFLLLQWMQGAWVEPKCTVW